MYVTPGQAGREHLAHWLEVSQSLCKDSWIFNSHYNRVITCEQQEAWLQDWLQETRDALVLVLVPRRNFFVCVCVSQQRAQFFRGKPTRRYTYEVTRHVWWKSSSTELSQCPPQGGALRTGKNNEGLGTKTTCPCGVLSMLRWLVGSTWFSMQMSPNPHCKCYWLALYITRWLLFLWCRGNYRYIH